MTPEEKIEAYDKAKAARGTFRRWNMMNICEPSLRITSDPEDAHRFDFKMPEGCVAIVDAECDLVCVCPREHAEALLHLLEWSQGHYPFDWEEE